MDTENKEFWWRLPHSGQPSVRCDEFGNLELTIFNPSAEELSAHLPSFGVEPNANVEKPDAENEVELPDGPNDEAEEPLNTDQPIAEVNEPNDEAEEVPNVDVEEPIAEAKNAEVDNALKPLVDSLEALANSRHPTNNKLIKKITKEAMKVRKQHYEDIVHLIEEFAANANNQQVKIAAFYAIYSLVKQSKGFAKGFETKITDTFTRIVIDCGDKDKKRVGMIVGNWERKSMFGRDTLDLLIEICQANGIEVHGLEQQVVIEHEQMEVDEQANAQVIEPMEVEQVVEPQVVENAQTWRFGNAAQEILAGARHIYEPRALIPQQAVPAQPNEQDRQQEQFDVEANGGNEDPSDESSEHSSSSDEASEDDSSDDEAIERVDPAARPCDCCGRNNTRRKEWFNWWLCDGCIQRSYRWSTNPPARCRYANPPAQPAQLFGCWSCSFDRLNGMGIIALARANGLFGEGDRNCYTGQILTNPEQVEYLREHFNAQVQDWENLPGYFHFIRERFGNMTDWQLEQLWEMADLFYERVQEAPDFFGVKGKNLPEFVWTVLVWYKLLVKIAANFVEDSAEVGPHCIAARGPRLGRVDRRALIETPSYAKAVARVICFLQNGSPPARHYQSSHICQFGFCGFWEHLIWETKGDNYSRIDCSDLAQRGQWTIDRCVHDPPCFMDGYFYVRTHGFRN